MFHSTTSKAGRSVRWDDTDDNARFDLQTKSRRASVRPNTESLRANAGNARLLSESFLPRIHASKASLREESIPGSMVSERNSQGASIGDIRSQLRQQDHTEAEWGGYGRKVRPGSRAGTGGRKAHKVPPWEISEEVKDALATLRQFREMSSRSVPIISNRLIHHIGIVSPALELTNYCRRVRFPLIKDSPMLSGWIEDIVEHGSANQDQPCLAISDFETAEGTVQELLDPTMFYTMIANGVHLQAPDFAPALASIHTLSLSDNGLGDSGVGELASSLPKNRSVQRFCCHYNHLTDQGASLLADNLTHNTTLQSLRLPFNRIGNAGGESLAELIGPCKCVSVMKAAIKEGQSDIVEALIKHGHPVNPFYSDEDPLLVLAASVSGSEAILDLLVDNGADLEGRDAKGRTAFLAAAQEGVVDAMEVLHLRGANVEARDRQGRSALLLAVMGGHSACAEYMVEKINEYPLRLVLKVGRLRDFAFDPLSQAVPPSPAHSQAATDGGGAGIRGLLGRAGSSLMRRRPSNVSKTSVVSGDGTPARRGSNASISSLVSAEDNSEASVRLQGEATSSGKMNRRGSAGSAELGPKGGRPAAELRRRGSNASDVSRDGARRPRKDSLEALSKIGQRDKTSAKQRRILSMAEAAPEGQRAGLGSMMDKLRQTGTALKKNLRKASLALDAGGLMAEYRASKEELSVEAFLLFRFAGTEKRTANFRVGENCTAEIREVISFQDLLAGPSPLFTMDLWVIHPETGEEAFAGMCMLSASELLVARKPMEAEWNDVADDSGTRTCSVQLSMRIFPEMMFEQSKLGELVVVEAARSGSTKLVHYFAAMGVDLNCRDGNGNTPLILAAREGRWHTVKSLLRSKVDVAAENRAGMSALAMAERQIGDDDENEEGEEAASVSSKGKGSDLHVVAELLQAVLKSTQGVPVSIRAWSIGEHSDTLKDPLDFLKDLFKGAYQRSSLTVSVKRARNLPQVDVAGKADPFVRVTLNYQTRETKVHKRTLEPEWNEVFVFDDQTLGVWPEQELLVEVFDWNLTKAPEFLGMCKLTVAEMLRLQSKKSDAKGECWLRLREKNDMLIKADRGTKREPTAFAASSASLSPLARSGPDASSTSFLGTLMKTGSSKSGSTDRDKTGPPLLHGASGGSGMVSISSGDAELLLSFRVTSGKGRYLHVEVVEARGLPSMHGDGARPNASCTLCLFKTTVATETVKRDANPRWGHGFRFEMQGTDATLELELRELLRPPGQNRIGRVYAPLSKIMSLVECGMEDVWIELEDEEGARLKGDNGESAAIRLRFKVATTGDHMSAEQTTELILQRAKAAKPKVSEEARFLLRQLTEGADPLVRMLGLFERLRSEGGGFIGIEPMLDAAATLSMDDSEFAALKHRYLEQLAGAPGCSDPGHFCRLLGLGGLWEREQKERAATGMTGRSGRSFREKPEVVVNQGVQAVVGLKVVLRRAAIEENPELENDSGGGVGTIVWVDPDDLDGDGQVGDVCQVRWERTGVKDDYRTGFEGDFRLAVAGTGEGSAPAMAETIIRRDVPAEVGQRVVLSKIAMLLDPELRKASMDGPGTIVWVDTEDKDGDGDTGDVCQVVWDATGRKGQYNTGFSGDYRLALYEPMSKIAAREIASIAGLHSTSVLRELVLDDNLIGKFGVTQLAQALRGNHTLTKLSLRRNRAEAAGANALGEAMKENQTLTELQLCANMIGDDGLLEMTHALQDRNAAPIRSLDLEENGIGAIGSKYIARALVKNKTLTWLSLSNNLVGTDGAPLLEQGLRRSASLLELNLDRNVLGNAGMRCLARAMRHMPALVRKKAQPANRVLRVLRVAQNNLSDESVEFVLEGLYKNYSLRAVHLGNNRISPEAEQRILDALANNVHEAQLEAGVIALQKIYRGRKERLAIKAQREAEERAARRRQLRAPSEAEVMTVEEGEENAEEAVDGLAEAVAEREGAVEVPDAVAEPGEQNGEIAESADGCTKSMGEEKAQAEEERRRAEEEVERKKAEEIRLGGQSEEQNDLLLAATKAHMFNMGEALLAEQRAAEEMAKESSERVKTALDNYEYLDGRLKWLLERNDADEEELDEAALHLHEAEGEAVEAMAAAEKAEEAARKCLEAMEQYHAFEREESEMADAIHRMKSGTDEEEEEEEKDKDVPRVLVKRVSTEAWIMNDGEGEEGEREESVLGDADQTHEDETGKKQPGSVSELDGYVSAEEEDAAAGLTVATAMEKGHSAMEQFSRLHAVLDLSGAGRGQDDVTSGDVAEDDAEGMVAMRAEVAEFNRRQEEAVAALQEVEDEMEREVGAMTALIQSAAPKTAVSEAAEKTEAVQRAVRDLEAAIATNDEQAVDSALRAVEEAEERAAAALARAERMGSKSGGGRGSRGRHESLVLGSVQEGDEVGVGSEGVETEHNTDGGGDDDGTRTLLFVGGRRLQCTVEGFGVLRRVVGRVCRARPSRAQRDLDNAHDMSRRIAVVDCDLPGVTRGAVPNVTKVERCVRAGAAAVVLVHVGRQGLPDAMPVPDEVAGWPGEWRVPVVSVREDDGTALVEGEFVSIATMVTEDLEEDEAPIELGRLVSQAGALEMSDTDSVVMLPNQTGDWTTGMRREMQLESDRSEAASSSVSDGEEGETPPAETTRSATPSSHAHPVSP